MKTDTKEIEKESWAIDHEFEGDDEMKACLQPPDHYSNRPFGKFPFAKFDGRNVWCNRAVCPHCKQKFLGVDLLVSICRYCKKTLA